MRTLSSNNWESSARFRTPSLSYARARWFSTVRVDRYSAKDDRIPGKPAAVIKDLSGLAGVV